MQRLEGRHVNRVVNAPSHQALPRSSHAAKQIDKVVIVEFWAADVICKILACGHLAPENGRFANSGCARKDNGSFWEQSRGRVVQTLFGDPNDKKIQDLK